MTYVQAFVLFDGFVVMALIGYLLRRAPRSGARLRLQQSAKSPQIQRPGSKQSSAPIFESSRSTRQLTVNFNYNGHSWEAYEVLGLPAGAPFDQVELAFEVLALKSDPNSLPFFVAALEAIRELRKTAQR
jgi:hypothetical protein